MKPTPVLACLRQSAEERLLSNAALRIGKGETVFKEYFLGERTDEYTMFDMASVTKIAVTTPLILMAMERGLLTLDTPVSRFFPCPKDKKGLTIKHLLTHTVGIGHKSLNREGITRENVARAILEIPSDCPIGTEVRYSCPGFILLGKIAEQVFDERLDDLFLRRIATPLGMTDSRYRPDKTRFTVNGNLTEEDRGKVNDYNCRFLGEVCGNAGLFSNLNDMTRFVRLLQNNGAPLLKKETFALARQNHTADKNESRGLGFLYVDERYSQTGTLFPEGSIGHCGHTGQSVFVHPESGFYVILLTDATVSTVRTFGKERYDKVILLREKIHNAIRAEWDTEERELP